MSGVSVHATCGVRAMLSVNEMDRCLHDGVLHSGTLLGYPEVNGFGSDIPVP